MTKSDEITILREAAEKLGSASYCGPWLRGILPGIERDIASDNPPGVQTPAEYAASVIAEAKREADEMLRKAKLEADRMLRDAGNQLAAAKASRDAANRALVAAHRTIGDLIRAI
jgi:cell division septum initiation protein DivIVA